MKTTRFWVKDGEIIERNGIIDTDGSFVYNTSFGNCVLYNNKHFTTKNEAIHDALRELEDMFCTLEAKKNKLMGMLE